MLSTQTYDCGDPSTVQSLYKRLGPAALGKTVRLVRRHDLAQEIVHDVFVKLWRQRLRFETEKQAFLWVYKTCHCAAIDTLRSTARRTMREARYHDEESWAAALPEFAGMSSFLTKVLTSMPAQTVQIFMYRELEGLTQDEIAELTGVSRKTVQRVLNRLVRYFAQLTQEE